MNMCDQRNYPFEFVALNKGILINFEVNSLGNTELARAASWHWC